MPLALIAFVVVADAAAVPPLNSKAAQEAVIVNPVVAVVGAAFITKVVAFVTEATVALFARPVPVSDMPAKRPPVLSHVTVVLAAVVTQLVNEAPFTISVAAPVAVAFAVSTNCVLLVTEAIFVAVVPFTGMFGPLTSMPGQSPAVLPQVTFGLPLVVVAFASVMAGVRLDCSKACRVLPAPTVVQALIAPLPFQLFDPALAKTSLNTSAVT